MLKAFKTLSLRKVLYKRWYWSSFIWIIALAAAIFCVRTTVPAILYHAGQWHGFWDGKEADSSFDYTKTNSKPIKNKQKTQMLKYISIENFILKKGWEKLL